jgi:TonB family protein
MSKGEEAPISISKLDLPISSLSNKPPSNGAAETRLEIRVVKSTPDRESSLSSGGAPAGDASGIDMSEIDAAIVAAFRNHWVLPSKLGEDHRNLNVVMDVSIERDGQVNGALLVKSSGTAEIDASALNAAERIKNIGVRLPPEFLGDRYEVRMHFHAE